MLPALKQDLTPSLTGDEGKLQTAIVEKRIFESEDETLAQALRYCFQLVGLRSKNFPDKNETVFLMKFIRENYGGHTPAEIRLAFEMAVTGKLGVDPVCYENFSPVYFAGIMNKFRSWASPVVAQLPPPQRIPTKDQLTDIDCDYAHYLKNQVNKLPFKK